MAHGAGGSGRAASTLQRIGQLAARSSTTLQLQRLAGLAADSPASIALQRHAALANHAAQAGPNRTGLPDQLKSGIETLSGISLDHVKVHYNSDRPAQLQAHAYAQGHDIHVGPGQERHLPHEAWHVVQQAQGRVRPTVQMKGGAPVNDDAGLEREADVMGQKALATGSRVGQDDLALPAAPSPVLQRRMGFEFETSAHIYANLYNYPELVPDEAEIFHGNGWKLVSDSGRMEFVSDPFDSLAAFTPVVNEIAHFISHAMVGIHSDMRVHNAGNWNVARVGPAGTAVYLAQDQLNSTPIGAHDVYGNPQVSVGVKMESLGKFLNRLATKDTFNTMRRRLISAGRPEEARKVGKLLAKQTIARTVGAMPKAERLVLKWAGNLQRAEQNQLRGIWQLITHYWGGLSRYKGVGDGYVKAKLPVMARTDFHSMFNALTPAAQLAFTNAREDFLGLNIPMNAKQDHLVSEHAFSMQDWYGSIVNPGAYNVPVNGVNQVPSHTFQGHTKAVDLVSDDQTVATGTNKSMGQFDMDQHDPANIRAVFELRHVTGGVLIPIADLEPHILRPVFTLLNNVDA